MVTVGTGAAQLDLKLQINSARTLYFIFRTYDSTTDTYSYDDISTKTFSFFLKRYKGDRNTIFTLTNNNGITVPTYSTYEITVSISASNVNIEEGQYYWELRRTDLNQAKVSGNAYLSYNAPQ